MFPSGRVLYIFTPPPGVPFRFKSKSDATQPSHFTNSNHVTASCNAVTFATHVTLVGFARLVGVSVCLTVKTNCNRAEGSEPQRASTNRKKMENTNNFQLLNARSGQSVNLAEYAEAVASGDRTAVENAESFGLVAVQRENGVASDAAITAAAATMRQAIDGYLNRPVAGQGAIPDNARIRVLECAEGTEDEAIFLRPFQGRRNNGQSYQAIAVVVRFNLLDTYGNVLASFVDIPLGMLTWDEARRTDAQGVVRTYAQGHIGADIEAQNMTMQEAVRFLQGRILRTRVETYMRPGRTNPTRLVSLVEEAAPAPAPAAPARGRGRRNNG